MCCCFTGAAFTVVLHVMNGFVLSDPDVHTGSRKERRWWDRLVVPLSPGSPTSGFSQVSKLSDCRNVMGSGPTAAMCFKSVFKVPSVFSLTCLPTDGQCPCPCEHDISRTP